ncbi:extracellular catalytic domain type 1 short-chain-length polyhydroxyalkanoate depolymerase [Niallia endozanthoxylica]|uniref:extracellular catalytic domain type 1 short-chain-length polyhydroxyalkanoate depolymerase n=1 Tax=Niallia endozanthoxylica TaxID=2036016 RepID=UPI00168AE307|nr:PHB depolymerase family esterase [Niallia endozanthoxylica]
MGEFLNFVHQGYKYKLYVPGEYHIEKQYPLLVMLHGCGQNPDDFAAGTNMNEQAEKENFLVLYPDMNHPLHPRDPAGYNPFGCWNWFLDKNQHRDEGHPKLIYEMIHEVKSEYNIDSNKVYAAGLSAGGSLACILGVTYPDVFSGIGICSGLAYDAANVFFLTDPMAEEAKTKMEKGVTDPYECGNSAFQEMGEYKKKMRVIVFHGICDTTVHPINGLQVITQWVQTNFLIEGGIGLADVTPAKVKSDIINGKSYTRHVYHDKKDEPLLELWMIDQMGHTWSGGNPSGSYTDSAGPNATEIIWNFLHSHQQQTKEKRIDTPVKQLSKKPVKLLPPPQDPSPGELPSITTVQQPDHILILPSVTTPVQTATEKPTETAANPSTEATVKTKDESPGETPKKNFLSTLLSKLIKKKTK